MEAFIDRQKIYEAICFENKLFGRNTNRDVKDKMDKLNSILTEEMSKANTLSGEYIARLLKNSGMTFRDIHYIVGIDIATLHRACVKPANRPYTYIGWEYAEALAYKAFAVSCNEMYLGYNIDAPVDRKYVPILEAIREGDKSRKEEIRGFIREELNASKISSNETFFEKFELNGVSKPQLLFNRIRNLANERYVSISRPSRYLTPAQISYMRQIIQKTPKGVTQINSKSVCILAILLDVPVDYLVCANYLNHCDASYYDKNGKLRSVSKEDMRWLREIVSAPDAISNIICGKIMSKILLAAH